MVLDVIVASDHASGEDVHSEVERLVNATSRRWMFHVWPATETEGGE